MAVSLIVGSAPSAADVVNFNLDGVCKVSINNAWKLRGDFNYSLFPNDFPRERRPGSDWPAPIISDWEYVPSLKAAGGLIFCGATMAFVAGYWATHKLASPVIAFYACDMIYSAAVTHFYGVGAPDPLRHDVSLRSLEAKSARLFAWALSRGVLLVNSSREAESRLVFPRLSLEDARLLTIGDEFTRSWEPLLIEAARIFALEATAPFDPMRHEYWSLLDTPEKRAFIDSVDRAWLDTIPLIKKGWADRSIS